MYARSTCVCMQTQTRRRAGLSSVCCACFPCGVNLPSPLQPRCGSIWLWQSPVMVQGSGDGQQSPDGGSYPKRRWSHKNMTHFSSLGSSVKCLLSMSSSLFPPAPPHCPNTQGLAPALLHPRLSHSAHWTRALRVFGFLCSCRMRVGVTQL